MLKHIVIIPARYASSRFPGKPLAIIKNKPMIQHVYESCLPAIKDVFVATDDERIKKVVKGFGGNVVMTSNKHESGTDRIAEAARKLSENIDFDVVVNVQGDEPFIESEQLNLIKNCFEDDKTDIATLIQPIENDQVLFDPSKVKVVCDNCHNALYFSREAIPYQRDIAKDKWLENHRYFFHLGMYAYRANVLQEVSLLKMSTLEKAEKLEQLRWLENGYTIRTDVTFYKGFGIDTPDDLDRANVIMKG